MAVYFVYRSPYEGPAGKHVKRFEDPTVLAWFQNHWQHLVCDDAYERLEALLGCDVCGLGSLFELADGHCLSGPETELQLEAYLENYLYEAEEILFDPHVIQVQADDDEHELAYYFFDDTFLAQHPDRAAYLLHDPWELPTGQEEEGLALPGVVDLEPAGIWEGSTYAVLLDAYVPDNLTDLSGGYRIPGVRLPQLARYLIRNFVAEGEWPWELLLIRSQLLAEEGRPGTPEAGFLEDIRSNPHDDTPWLVYSDWLCEQNQLAADLVLLEQGLRRVCTLPVRRVYAKYVDEQLRTERVEESRRYLASLVPTLRPSSHDPGQSRVQVAEHVAQVGLHIADHGGYGEWHQWIFFDDQWARAHPALAQGLLTYATRWDVLSDPEETGD
jgi:uncharacterized protein (TIGR02996 family)